MSSSQSFWDTHAAKGSSQGQSSAMPKNSQKTDPSILVSKLCEQYSSNLEKKVKIYVYFHILFFILVLAQLFAFVFFASILARSSVLAVFLALLFLSSFSYFVLRLYFISQKTENFALICHAYVKDCKRKLHYVEGQAHSHLALASALSRFVSFLKDKELTYYTLPAYLDSFTSSMEKFSMWWHWQDLFFFKELLLHTAIEENVKLVKCEATNLEAHATLANSYVLLAALYKPVNFPALPFSFREFMEQAMEEKFKQVSTRAMEEFKILHDYAPEDPWIYQQLAYSYHDLEMFEEEILQYESILKLCPNDLDSMLKLGILYFQQGHNAKGLQVYKQLKQRHYKKAEELIHFYGALQFRPLETF